MSGVARFPLVQCVCLVLLLAACGGKSGDTPPPLSDVERPIVTITSPAGGSSVTAGEQVSATGTATDDVGVVGVTVAVGGATPVAATVSAESWQFDFTPTAIGELTIAAVATDAAGNTATASVSVTVRAPGGDASGPGELQGSLVAGTGFSFAVRDDGTVLSWGHNSAAQVGQGDNPPGPDYLEPTPMADLEGIVQIAAGGIHALALSGDGKVYGWGQNGHGQVGVGRRSVAVTSPVLLTGLTDIVQVAAGYDSSFALGADGTVYVWGNNDRGQLGLGESGFENRRLAPVELEAMNGRKIVAIHSGSSADHVFARAEDGTVYGWGRNSSGQLGLGDGDDRDSPAAVAGLTGITHIAPGWRHTIALRDDGTVWGWGSNIDSALGLGPDEWGIGEYRREPVQVPGLSSITQVAAGDAHGLALAGDGTVYSWGRNFNGVLGVGDRESRYSPVKVEALAEIAGIIGGNRHAFALGADGQVWVWGHGQFGELGLGVISNEYAPVALGLPGD